VILVSSEHSFPYHLKDLGFNTKNISENIFMGEVPPKDVYKLLTEEWKIREKLAISLMEYFGGHILDHLIAISRLELEKDNFDPSGVYDFDSTAGLLSAITSMSTHPDTGHLQKKDLVLELKKKKLPFSGNKDELLVRLDSARMKEYLTHLAVSGFVPISHNPYEDRVCAALSKENVGGVVNRGSMVVGLPKTSWQGIVIFIFFVPCYFIFR
jgi:hypothetical protein